MWVADMDFAVAPMIASAIQERAALPIYGYTQITEEYRTSIVNWMKNRHDAHVEADWIVPIPGVVPAIDAAILTLTRPGDRVLLHTPVYFPFYASIENNGRHVVSSSLILGEEGASIDFQDFETKLKQVQAFILCNPHNPTGKVYTKEELEKIAMLCRENDVAIIADEIHHDLLYSETTFTSILNVATVDRSRLVFVSAPSKTFNIAGLAAAHFILPDEELRKAIQKTQQCVGTTSLNAFAIAGSQAAYRHGAEWNRQCMAYIENNRDQAIREIRTNMPQIRVMRPQGTYFLWLDCRALGMPADRIDSFFLEKAKIRFNPGAPFGKEGLGFVRMNIACTNETLHRALLQMHTALREREGK
jgi:Bifunctional PLP-dependent enzyme with beta-cystathionase and maltose regulon repressor activities